MGPIQDSKPGNHSNAKDRRILARYSVLTIGLLVPLLLSFAFIRNLYPFAASTMMIRDRDRGSNYYILRGETLGGETIELPPITLTNALSGRHWSLVDAAVENKSFKITSLHPENERMAAAHVSVGDLPRAARLEELLRAWGNIYNSRLPGSAPQRLRSVRLDAYRWDGDITNHSGHLVESWRAAL